MFVIAPDELIQLLYRQINYLYSYDTLTDLPNRTLFNFQATKILEAARRIKEKVALLYLDLDHFKNINDSYGHHVGDQLLISVVNRLQSHLQEDHLFARVGGDEFMIMIMGATNENIVTITNNLCKSFEKPFYINNKNIYITTSIGISIYPDDGPNIQSLFKNVDMANYRAKQQQRNTFSFYTQELNAIVTRKLLLESLLYTALDKKEFSLYYQPLVNIKDKTISSFEALIRWQHPELGEISPSEFIPIAEEIGLIIPISEWVIRTACKQIIKWQDLRSTPLSLRIAINLSARQFRVHNLAEIIANILQETHLKGEHLTFELTETLLMHDIKHSTEVLKKIKSFGIHIALDDFGTCYSSLNYLRHFPIDQIKIDRSFITDIATDANAEAIVTAIIAMAKSLKIKVIAEGVETIEQYYLLEKNGCDSIQGYLISPPLPSGEIYNSFQEIDFITTRLDNLIHNSKNISVKSE